VFLGTPEAAVPSLKALVSAGHEVATVVTRADRRRGRGTELSPSPVKAAAVDLGLAVTDQLDQATGIGAEMGVVVAFGRILRPEFLARLPCVNLHFSLLPRWRGAAPVERAVLAGDAQTGVCLMQVEEGLDTGGVYAKVVTAIGSDETADELRARLSQSGAELLVKTLNEGLEEPQPQFGEVTYADKVGPEDRHLNWSEPSEQLVRVVRIGRAWTTLGGRRLLVHSARIAGTEVPAGAEPGRLIGTGVCTATGMVELVEVQPEGRAVLQADQWVRGLRADAGLRLGS
jgi:methionyl-tRNA formyltransferase